MLPIPYPVLSLLCACYYRLDLLLNDLDVWRKLLKFWWLLCNKDRLAVAALVAVEFVLISVEIKQLGFLYGCFLFDWFNYFLFLTRTKSHLFPLTPAPPLPLTLPLTRYWLIKFWFKILEVADFFSERIWSRVGSTTLPLFKSSLVCCWGFRRLLQGVLSLIWVPLLVMPCG